MLKKITITLIALVGIGLMLVGCKASGEIGDTATSITAPR